MPTMCCAVVALLLALGVTTPVLDGAIGQVEWSQAELHAMTPGATLRLLATPDALSLAVQLPTNGWGHVSVFDGETIQVLHMSAALGLLRYRRKGDKWQTVDRFVWQLRDRVYWALLQSAQDQYYNENDWVGTKQHHELAAIRAEGAAFARSRRPPCGRLRQ